MRHFGCIPLWKNTSPFSDWFSLVCIFVIFWLFAALLRNKQTKKKKKKKKREREKAKEPEDETKVRKFFQNGVVHARAKKPRNSNEIKFRLLPGICQKQQLKQPTESLPLWQNRALWQKWENFGLYKLEKKVMRIYTGQGSPWPKLVLGCQENK